MSVHNFSVMLGRATGFKPVLRGVDTNLNKWGFNPVPFDLKSDTTWPPHSHT